MVARIVLHELSFKHVLALALRVHKSGPEIFHIVVNLLAFDSCCPYLLRGLLQAAQKPPGTQRHEQQKNCDSRCAPIRYHCSDDTMPDALTTSTEILTANPTWAQADGIAPRFFAAARTLEIESISIYKPAQISYAHRCSVSSGEATRDRRARVR
jgi:hypothetical protein